MPAKTKVKAKAKAKAKVSEPTVQTPALVEVSVEPPSDSMEQLDLAVKQIGRGNTHVAVKTLIEVVRGLL